jgi:hypothetical protein
MGTISSSGVPARSSVLSYWVLPEMSLERRQAHAQGGILDPLDFERAGMADVELTASCFEHVLFSFSDENICRLLRHFCVLTSAHICHVFLLYR